VTNVLKNYDMVSLTIFEVISDKFKVNGICTSGNYAQKWITELFNY